MAVVESNDGARIAFDRSGTGPPVIVVLGAFNARPAAAPLAEHLAAQYTVFNYDRRGRGESGDNAPYAVEREIEDLESLIIAAGGSACVFGHSSGAVLALYAAARGLAITKLAMYEPPFVVPGDRPLPPSDFAAQLAELVSSGRRGDAVELFQTKGIGMPADLVERLRQAPSRPAFEALAHTLVYDAVITGDLAVPTDVAKVVTIPTLVIDGGASPSWRRRAVQAVADAIPNARRRTLDGQTHDLVPSILAPVLAEFFS